MKPGDEIEINLDDVNRQHVVYSVFASYVREIIYVGSCKRAHLMQLPDANKNSEFRSLMKSPEYRQSLRVKVIDVCNDTSSAEMLASACIAALRPYCNVNGKTLRGPNSPIICNDDGLEFPSLAAAAAHYGFRASAISNHLNGQPGYPWVRGKTFRRK